MKRALLAVTVALALVWSGSASAQSPLPLPSPCVKGTLASYIALGARGCSIGGTTFASFSYSSPSTAIRPEQILVVPPSQISPGPRPVPGFTFQAPWLAKAGQTLTSVIGYTAAPNMWAVDSAGPLPAGLLTLNLGAAQVFDIFGSVLVQEETSIGTLSVYQRCTEVCTIKESDQLVYSPIKALKVVDTVTVAGGNGGASLSSFSQTFGPAYTVY